MHENGEDLWETRTNSICWFSWKTGSFHTSTHINSSTQSIPPNHNFYKKICKISIEKLRVALLLPKPSDIFDTSNFKLISVLTSVGRILTFSHPYLCISGFFVESSSQKLGWSLEILKKRWKYVKCCSEILNTWQNVRKVVFEEVLLFFQSIVNFISDKKLYTIIWNYV